MLIDIKKNKLYNLVYTALFHSIFDLLKQPVNKTEVK